MVDGGEPGVDSRDEGKHTGRNDLLFVGNEYGKTLPLPIQRQNSNSVVALVELEIYEQFRLYFETWRYPENRKYRGTHCTLYSDATSKH